MKCKNCTHYQHKDWSINYECALGHKTPDFGDTGSCTDFNESWASEIIRGGNDYSNSSNNETDNKSHIKKECSSGTNEFSNYTGGYSGGGSHIQPYKMG